MNRAWTQITPPTTADGWVGVGIAIPPNDPAPVLLQPGHSLSGMGALLAKKIQGPFCKDPKCPTCNFCQGFNAGIEKALELNQ